MSEHSPLPWNTGELDNGRLDYVFAHGQAIADCEFVGDGRVNEANAALIVRAVNSHAQLVAALEKIAGYRDYDASDHAEASKYKPLEGLWTTDEYLADSALSLASLKETV
jgi:hypothetical protein